MLWDNMPDSFPNSHKGCVGFRAFSATLAWSKSIARSGMAFQSPQAVGKAPAVAHGQHSKV
jgi:hypothetical protein